MRPEDLEPDDPGTTVANVSDIPVPDEPARRQIWRVGRKVGRTIYLTPADDPDGDGTLIGVMDTRELARMAAAAPELYRALKSCEFDNQGFCPACKVECDPNREEDDQPHEADCWLTAALKKARGE